MGLEDVVQWTRTKLSALTGDVPVISSSELDALMSSPRVALPPFDLFENERELRVVLDVPGASPHNTHVAWNGFDTLSVHVRRGTTARGAAAGSEIESCDWYRDIIVSPDADGSKAHSTVRHSVLTVRIPKRRTSNSKLIPAYAA